MSASSDISLEQVEDLLTAAEKYTSALSSLIHVLNREGYDMGDAVQALQREMEVLASLRCECELPKQDQSNVQIIWQLYIPEGIYAVQ